MFHAANSARMASRMASRRYMATQTSQSTAFMKQGAKRDPELYVLLGVMCGAFGLAGFYFGRKPTSATSEADVSVAAGTKPWEKEHESGSKYGYHPRGDTSATPRSAPSALNTVIVPDVTLPESLHERFNKYGKDDY